MMRCADVPLPLEGRVPSEARWEGSLAVERGLYSDNVGAVEVPPPVRPSASHPPLKGEGTMAPLRRSSLEKPSSWLFVRCAVRVSPPNR